MAKSRHAKRVEGNDAFAIKDCALVALATGKKAQQLQEFRNEVASINTASIYHHFWGGLLQPRFEEREYNNDFASWVRHGIHDAVLAEQLSALDPTSFTNLDSLRQEIVELVDARLDEAEHLYWMRATQPFEFVRSQIVVFDTEKSLTHPSELVSAISDLSISSIFYHFIDARRRTRDTTDDFTNWLGIYKSEYQPLIEILSDLDPYFSSLNELRERLSKLFSDFFMESTS